MTGQRDAPVAIDEDNVAMALGKMCSSKWPSGGW
jgi:hypothetical protein